jgi:hypothetical protein
MVLVLGNYDPSILQSNFAINHTKVDIFQPEECKERTKIRECLMIEHMNTEKHVTYKSGRSVGGMPCCLTISYVVYNYKQTLRSKDLPLAQPMLGLHQYPSIV